MKAGFVTSFVPTAVRHEGRLSFCGTAAPSAVRLAPRTAQRNNNNNNGAVSCTAEREVADENDALQRELRAKVKELYGGAENVTIAVNGERAEFTVRRDNTSSSEHRAAVFTVSSIAVLSVLAGLVFAFMYKSGAVHGSPNPGSNTYPYHSSSSSSTSRARVDPYALLGRDLEFTEF